MRASSSLATPPRVVCWSPPSPMLAVRVNGASEGGDQYTPLGGVASDDVARMQLFLGSGEAQPIPLRDNAWLTRAARADYPIRVVAYDREDRIIGIQTMDTP